METNDELKHIICKLQKKNFDMVILNSMNEAYATFGFDTNKITVIKNNFSRTAYSLKSKKEVTEDIIHEIENALLEKLIDGQEESLQEHETMCM